jgi:hypothetical protein
MRWSVDEPGNQRESDSGVDGSDPADGAQPVESAQHFPEKG